MTLHGRAGEYLEGTLTAADEEAFLEHVVDCAACQAELHGEVQLRDREDTLRAAAAKVDALPGSADVVPIDRARRRRTIVIGAIGLAAAAALVIALRPHPKPRAPQVALADKRSIETRIAGWKPAAAYRDYDPMRSGAATSETIDPRVIAELTRTNDCGAIAAAYVLSNELERAKQRYDLCGPGVELDADRAGLAVLRHDPEAALELADRALAVNPDHPTALWNRALALRDLGLGLAAAAAFDRVAAVDPSWADEAKRRALTAGGPLQDQRHRFDALIEEGRAMHAGGPVITLDRARAVPGRARLLLHEELIATTDPARLDQLAAVAAVLDGQVGSALERYVGAARARRDPPDVVERYHRALAGGDELSGDAWPRWLALARRGHASDELVLGARVLARQPGDGEPDGASMLAARIGDPWFTTGVDLTRVRALWRAGSITDAAALVGAVETTACGDPQLGFRCAQARRERARIEFARYQFPAARTAIDAALALATSLGEWELRTLVLTTAGQIERRRGHLALARGFYEELAASWDDCTSRDGRYLIADTLFREHRFAEASASLRTAPACAEPLDLDDLNLHARLRRAGAPVLDRAALDGALASLDGAASNDVEHDSIAYVRAWIAIEEPAAQAALAALYTRVAGRSGVDDRKIALAVATSLAVAAGERGDWTETVARAAVGLGVPVPTRCALVVAVDDYRLVAVSLDGAGAVIGHVERDRTELLPARWIAPAPLRSALASCPSVTVLAMPPWTGVGPVLDPAVAWRYAMMAPLAAPPGPARRVVVADATPPAVLGLPALAPSAVAPDTILVSGAAASPERVLAEMRTATTIELRTHAVWTELSDTPVLALSPGANGWALSAEAIGGAHLERAPVVILASCAGGVSAPYLHEAWGLPLAFRLAGARVVIAPLREIPDREAAEFFDRLTAALDRGVDPAAAVAALRAEKIARDPTSWVESVVVFE